MSFSAGTFSINTTGQPVVSGTSISASVFNALTADLATGLSTCMLKDGTQTATAGIGFYAGTVSLPGIYFGTDTATGLYRIGLNNTGFAINGTKLLDIGTTVLGVVGSVTVNTITVNSGTTATVFNTTATTVNAFGAASVALNIGHASGTNTILGASSFSQSLVTAATTDSTSISTGALQSAGGAGITKALWVGGLANIAGNLSASGGTYTFSGTFPGSTSALLLKNLSNTAGSVANIGVTVGGSSAGDPSIYFDTSGVVAWAVGSDTSDSSKFVISTGAFGGASDWLKITTAGVVTVPNLAGTGTRAVVVDANGVLSAP